MIILNTITQHFTKSLWRDKLQFLITLLVLNPHFKQKIGQHKLVSWQTNLNFLMKELRRAQWVAKKMTMGSYRRPTKTNCIVHDSFLFRWDIGTRLIRIGIRGVESCVSSLGLRDRNQKTWGLIPALTMTTCLDKLL